MKKSAVLNYSFLRIALSLIMLLGTTFTAKAQTDNSGYPYAQVPFTNVQINENSFWGQRLAASRNVTIPLAFSKCEETQRYENFTKAHQHIIDPSKVFEVNQSAQPFDDTDPYKTLEGASYLMQTYPNATFKGKSLDAYCDSVIDVIASGQEPDGYLNTFRTMNPDHPHHWQGQTRWCRVEELSHEFYNLGHMCEAAVAHYVATGKKNFLNIAIRYADCICREIGRNPGQLCVVPGHQIAEMGLAKLYLATGDRKYLEQAKFFLDERGKTTIKAEYSQSHKPVVEQDEAVGHAVRAGYMYAGMADIAALTGDKSYVDAIDRIWENIVSKKFYITGGVGATSNGEAFGANYELPNMSAYCETCAAIAQVYLNYRLFLLHGESKYYDALERSLYNGVISGISIDGGKFFYPNPLQSIGQHERQAWFGCACCPSNVARFIPSLPQYMYAVKDNHLYINLFNGNTMTTKVGGRKVTLEQVTNYPWDGDVQINVKKGAGEYAINIRIPGWVKGEVVPSNLYTYSDGKQLGYSVKVNGELMTGKLQNGYFVINRKWKNGDRIDVHFDMEARTVHAHSKVAADKGRAAIEKGPIVYCAEWPDNKVDVLTVLLNQHPSFNEGSIEIEGTTIPTIIANAQSLGYGKDGRLVTTDEHITLIPYYAWAHRGTGNMAVWLPQEISATTPALPATIASKSKVTGSKQDMPSLVAANDRLIPADADDFTVPYTHWWPNKGTTEWIAYDFKEPTTVSTATVYWFDDESFGECRVPKAWKLLYKTHSGEWTEVKNPSEYTSIKGCANTVHFDAVKTSAMKLEVVLPDNFSSGVFEWEVK